MPPVLVSFLDVDGIRHSVEIDNAASLYEAAALAVCAFRKHECEPAPASRLEVEIRSSVTHTVTIKKLYEWLNGGAKTPKEKITKDRLRELVSSG